MDLPLGQGQGEEEQQDKEKQEVILTVGEDPQPQPYLGTQEIEQIPGTKAQGRPSRVIVKTNKFQ